MKRKNIIFLVLILAVMVGVFLYFRNKKKQDQYLGNMLTSSPEQQVLDDLALTGQRNPCKDQCDQQKQAPALLFGLVGGGYSIYNCRRCLKLNGLI